MINIERSSAKIPSNIAIYSLRYKHW